jgi:hypothetical protein
MTTKRLWTHANASLYHQHLAYHHIIGLRIARAALTISNLSENRLGMSIFHFPLKPALIAVREGRRGCNLESNGRGIEHKTLQELVESICPSLFNDFQPLLVSSA